MVYQTTAYMALSGDKSIQAPISINLNDSFNKTAMKKLFPVLLLFVLVSCSKDKSLNSSSFPQKWQLVKMTGQVPNSETTGENMDWQEYYQFNSDGTFTKHRDYQGETYEATGTFLSTNQNGDTYFELDFNTDSPIIGSCDGPGMEVLWLKSSDQLINTWQNCDGPGMEYARVK